MMSQFNKKKLTKKFFQFIKNTWFESFFVSIAVCMAMLVQVRAWHVADPNWTKTYRIDLKLTRYGVTWGQCIGPVKATIHRWSIFQCKKSGKKFRFLNSVYSVVPIYSHIIRNKACLKNKYFKLLKWTVGSLKNTDGNDRLGYSNSTRLVKPRN